MVTDFFGGLVYTKFCNKCQVIYCDMYMNITSPLLCEQPFESCGSLHWSQEIAKEGKADTVEESAPALAGSSESSEEILFNPNVFTEFKLSGDPEVNT